MVLAIEAYAIVLKYGIKIQYNYVSTMPVSYAYLSLKTFFASIKVKIVQQIKQEHKCYTLPK